MHIRTSLPHEITHGDFWIPLRDGTRLYARAWRPLTAGPVPALLEYQPGRLTDATAPRDRQRHPWYAGHGYVSVRVDARGYGNSDGLPTADPHAATALLDGVDVVEWLAAQPWCDGRVGMFGISWGGLASLRVAALAPEPLRAVVAVCPAGERHFEDLRRTGGSVLAGGLPARAAALLALAARPPDPAYVGTVWRDVWARRLEAMEPLVDAWPGDPVPDGLRPDGGPGENPGTPRAAVLAVGGWHEPHRDTVLGLVEQLPPDRVRGLIGPWSLQYPDHGQPGPAIGFLQETLRWWDHWLKDEDTGVMAEPLLRAYLDGPHPPATSYEVLPGRWIGESAWPSPQVTWVSYTLQGAPVLVRSPMHTGLDAGRFAPRGNDADLPPDQREEDARSVCFEFAAAEETWLLGRPRVRLRLTCPVPRAQVVARLCDVAPDGSSTLVTRGALNLLARHGPDRETPWPPGATEDVVFALNGIGHTFRAGHRIRLAVSSAYWPWLWPQPGSEAGFTLDPAGSSLELPVRVRESGPAIAFAAPEQYEPLRVSSPAMLEEPRPERLVVRDTAKGEWLLVVDPSRDGTRVYPDGLEVTEDALEAYTIGDSGPSTARARSDRSVRLHRPEQGWDARVETHSEVSCTDTDFAVWTEIVCKDGYEVVFHRTWERRIPRAQG
ncbi:CocE/NonD family hydrolase [Streptomyces nodosus]|uniref:CocE/NonD family hydrolase n=1 Tax=Streptomyces nodosus TaxID=40318 RepID=UPI00380EAAAF